MPKKEPENTFNGAALSYDHTFTYTPVGRLLRSNVHRYMEGVLPKNKSLRILEINCGTGEDAVYFGRLGHHITASDVSPAMIDVANQKIQSANLRNAVKCIVADSRELSSLGSEVGFDLVFSNFGGLNCLDINDLRLLSKALHKLLNPQGRIIAVVMPKFCLWESLYFSLKFRFSDIFRRNTRTYLEVPVGDVKVKTWYHSPTNMLQAFGPAFKKVGLRPLGTALPPSYLNGHFKRHPGMLHTLQQIERALEQIPILAYVSDHFILDLKKMQA